MNILSDKIVITRKKHDCNACGRVFNAGTKMKTQVNTFDGIGTYRECPTCMQLLSKHSSQFFDEYDGCYYENCVAESLGHNQTPEELLAELDNA